jgi:hypothetical protein
MKLHTGTLLGGLIYLVTGVAFVLEAVGTWTLALSDLRLVGPLALVVAGLAVIGSSSGRSARRSRRLT